ncbi:UDP-N-acetylmuramoyl-tripeptide--D-alanyl-D-alanine ligase [Rahnella aceris]|jgi:UDP-N-acetylmuramoyl-tripeptide--D-alanyl-D-alanine ligase|uniref:UDP-N-acetylmuramoyl-tripeptide--D-alanyl-D- alanine ligase n=1 Tax=Rahnella TaxID=34037 RepID=UPI000E65B530|nr:MULTISPECIES: UDP-N-acetylmuramoyl-tripeptide--D-alanyl-D-alanine ligase [Rahnella]AYA08625.1 UDP-N-acetylmuramoyl-tripeptide--D-alanyl-D-alanine ligase [Rahnella aquatilis]AZP52556.1 UDP-N-acetylmuramoyl-tripeptide--D-alanyl-D-alanine ligase [Rahnella aquatilis]MBU9843208.1 UDP-N-acetylmuramoyl-tripeptide--D-alanyl-D-alanine ligase [Rahnella aceris]MCM2445704.1 UDP-N-acetylmuramoyl-tripeptide--D-alanyl-D-alanine ligase [Rahnella sp. CG8]MQB53463.1 UDP-N-acetylmuramoyl-tripeptide--D-alanyl-
MIRVSLQTLADALNAELIGTDTQIDSVTTDTRQITEGCLFVALKGEKFDAHDFAADAVKAGSGALLVSKRLPVDVPQLVVADTRIALGQLGGWVRQQVPARVVGLTGSSGKTSVKEMTAAILRECGNVLYTAGNFNNDIGVPLTLLRLTAEHDFAVIEMGANHAGEIAYTTALARPETALVNNLSAAHLEGFGSLAGVARAKGEIFDGLPENGIAVINADNNDWANWQHKLNGKTVWRFSPTFGEGIDFSATDVNISPLNTTFTLHSPQGSIDVSLPVPGRHNIANALAAAALAMSVGASPENVRAGLATLQSVKGRLFPIVISEGKTLLDDSYNANVGSMTAAAQVLAEMPGYRVMAVGDMAELGAESEHCHRQVGEAIRDAGIDKVFSIGHDSRIISDVSGCGEHLEDKAALTARLTSLLSEHAVITVLIKGSRSAAMEQVVRALQENATC